MRLDRIKLKTARIRADLKQKEIAKITGLSLNTITSVFGGKSCSEATAVKIACALGVQPSEIQESR